MYAVTADGPWLLYDLGQDPYEQTNRVADPAYRAELEKLHALTRRWLRAWDDPYVLAPLAPAKPAASGSPR
jgi:arylsulfatase A-like enzyme